MFKSLKNKLFGEKGNTKLQAEDKLEKLTDDGDDHIESSNEQSLSKKELFKSNKPKSIIEPVYMDAIEKAIEENCSMIGLMGDYGAGKSTIIEGYIDKSDKHIIKISIPNYIDAPKQTNLSSEIRKCISMDLISKMDSKSETSKKLRGIKSRLNYYDDVLWGKREVAVLSAVIYFVLVHVLNLNIIVSSQSVSNFVNTMYILMFTIACVALLVILREKVNIRKINSFKIFNIGMAEDEEKSFIDYDLNTVIQLIQLATEGKKNSILIIEDLDRFEDIEILHEIHQLSRLLQNISIILPINTSIMKPALLSKYFDFQIIVHPINEKESLCEYIENSLLEYRKLHLSDKNKMDESEEKIETGIEVNIKLIDTIAEDIEDIRIFNSIFNYYIILKCKYEKVYSQIDKNNQVNLALRTEIMSIAYMKVYYPTYFNTGNIEILIYLYKNLENNLFRDSFLKMIETNENIDKIKDHDTLQAWLNNTEFKNYVYNLILEKYKHQITENEDYRKFYNRFLSLIIMGILSSRWTIFLTNVNSSLGESEAIKQQDTRRFKSEVCIKTLQVPNYKSNYKLSNAILEYYSEAEINNSNFIRKDYVLLLIDNYYSGGNKLFFKLLNVIEETIFSKLYLTTESIENQKVQKKSVIRIYNDTVEFKNEIEDMYKFLELIYVKLEKKIGTTDTNAHRQLVVLMLVSSTNKIEKFKNTCKKYIENRSLDQGTKSEILYLLEYYIKKSYDTEHEAYLTQLHLQLLEESEKLTKGKKGYVIDDLENIIDLFTRMNIPIKTQYHYISGLNFYESKDNILKMIETFAYEPTINLENNSHMWHAIKNNNFPQEKLSEIGFINRVINSHIDKLTTTIFEELNSNLNNTILISKLVNNNELQKLILKGNHFEKNEIYLKYLLKSKDYDKIINSYKFTEPCITKEIQLDIYENYSQLKSREAFIKKLNFQIENVPKIEANKPGAAENRKKLNLLIKHGKVYPSFENYLELLKSNQPHARKKILKNIDVDTIIKSEKMGKVRQFINGHFNTLNITDEVKIKLAEELDLAYSLKECGNNSIAVNEAVKKRNKS